MALLPLIWVSTLKPKIVFKKDSSTKKQPLDAATKAALVGSQEAFAPKLNLTETELRVAAPGVLRVQVVSATGISRRRWTAGLIRQGLPQRAARGGSQDSRAEKTVDPDQCPSCTSRRRASPTRGTSSTSAPSRTRSEGFDGWTSYSLAYHDGDDVGHSATIVGM